MFFPTISPLPAVFLMPMAIVIAIVVVVMCPTTTTSSAYVSSSPVMTQARTRELQHKFTEGLHAFLADKAVAETEQQEDSSTGHHYGGGKGEGGEHLGNKKNAEHKMIITISYADVAKVLTVIGSVVTKALQLNKWTVGCPAEHTNMSATPGYGGNDRRMLLSSSSSSSFSSSMSSSSSSMSSSSSSYSSDLALILHELGDEKLNHSLTAAADAFSPTTDDEARLLLTWLLSFCARMGYTVGYLGLNEQETTPIEETTKGAKKQQQQIQLDHFITAIQCIGLAESANYLPTTLTADDAVNKLHINFKANDKIEERIKYNFQSLAYLMMGGESSRKQQPVPKVIDLIGDIFPSCSGVRKIFYSNDTTPIRLIDRLMIAWFNGPFLERQYRIVFELQLHEQYVLNRFGHRLAQRLLNSEQLLEGYFQVFPGTKRRLTRFVAFLKEREEKYRQGYDGEYAETQQTLLHYEDAILFETNMEEVVFRLTQTIEEWRKMLMTKNNNGNNNNNNIDAIYKAVTEIGEQNCHKERLAEFAHLSGEQEEGQNNVWAQFTSSFSEVHKKVREAQEFEAKIALLKRGHFELVDSLKGKISNMFSPGEHARLQAVDELKARLKRLEHLWWDEQKCDAIALERNMLISELIERLYGHAKSAEEQEEESVKEAADEESAQQRKKEQLKVAKARLKVLKKLSHSCDALQERMSQLKGELDKHTRGKFADALKGKIDAIVSPGERARIEKVKKIKAQLAPLQVECKEGAAELESGLEELKKELRAAVVGKIPSEAIATLFGGGDESHAHQSAVKKIVE